jgi:RHS repeat-associated protein
VQSTFTYDTLNRVTGLSSGPASYTYQRGPTGNLTSDTESSGRTVNWTYDGIYRLTNETISSDPAKAHWAVGYGLDPVGNRKSEISTLGGLDPGSFNYNADDELATDSYDLNGNTVSTGGKAFTYDSENHLISMSANGTSVGILYNGDGNRVAKTVNGATTYYLVDNLNPTGLPQVMEELSSTGTVARRYTYGLGLIAQDLIVSNAWTPSFYEADGEGSVRLLTSEAGAVTDADEFDAFGNEINSTGTTPNEYLYRGEQWDTDLGLYYLRARYYNPATGRFLSVDSEGGAGQRRYEYAAADPVNGADPSGDEAIIEWAILAMYPSRLPFVHVFFPSWCGFSGSAALRVCEGGSGGGGTGAGGGAPGGPPQPPPQCTGPNCKPKCDAQLKYRPVQILGRTHAFWWIQDMYAQRFVIDGGPSNGDSPPFGDLIDWITPGDVSRRYPADNAALAPTWFDSGLSSSVCGQVTGLEVAAEDWPPTTSGIPYHPVKGPNSNSFARYVGEAGGGFHPTAPPGSQAWSHPIPTSQGPE